MSADLLKVPCHFFFVFASLCIFIQCCSIIEHVRELISHYSNGERLLSLI